MNTNDTRYDDDQLQNAIDNAMVNANLTNFTTLVAATSWIDQRPHRLNLARSLLSRLPEPANAELDAFRSFFGRASVALHQLDGLGDNGDTENFIERLQKLLEWKCTDAERTAVESLMQSQGLTALQVLRQALRHYQMDAQGKSEPTPPTADGKTPGQVAGFEDIAMKLCAIGWTANCDAQWEGLRDALPELRSMLGGQASLEAGIKRMEAVPEGELLKDYVDALDDELHSFEDRDEPLTTNAIKGFGIEAVRARLIAAAREGQPSNQPSEAEYYLPKIPNPLTQPAEIPWTEWEGGECPLKDAKVEKWEYRFRDGFTCAHTSQPSAYKDSWKHLLGPDDIIAYRVTKWREGQPAAVDWQARAEKAEARLVELEESRADARRKLRYAEEHLGILAKTFGYEGKTWCNMVSYLCPRLQKAESELANAKEIIGWRYADKPKSEPVLVPLDASDIRATDEFRLIGGGNIMTVQHWNNKIVFLSIQKDKEYAQLADNYERRQHGSTEWKPCTKPQP